uniref:ATP synthase complex subunit 8 n=1 Tax=Glyptotermes sp. 6 AB-2022a TaxID=2942729 RepID=A0A8X8RGG3_9NEOP|nr:ATP synthase F0 subunit 8 [Glyptotermes sp. 6 AB-2022a]URX52971.1 ATP synthase F0 subunit 8 [Glyptotermes sp. 6 AB-2022a]URX52984.1 ATP synthase F0 subunit 8 [Glyptotermes sp. 6 AB-2022a]URX54516.1 ATP synthase F0 subunit 8 [Glyptotermes sp. 6 AB-2022a]
MPQMMPLSWSALFIMFSMTLVLFATMNYYSHIPKTEITTTKKIKTKKMNWKW